jgi:hypothetical protein
MCQQIGDRAGEADTFQQLGMLAAELGKTEGGLRVVAVGCLIFQSIGHGHTDQSVRVVSQLAGRLGYTQAHLDTMLREIAESYAQDRGASLVAAAFAEAPLDPARSAPPPPRFWRWLRFLRFW